MAACRNCGGHLAKNEVKCFMCDEPAVEVKNPREARLAWFRIAVTVGFFACLGLTIVAIFMDIGATFGECAAATVILHFVKMSAVGMSEPKNS